MIIILFLGVVFLFKWAISEINIWLSITRASERLQQQRARERKEQYKQVRAHVKKEDGRMQAYGWSLPIHQASDPKSGHNSSPKSSLSFDPNFPVPIPVYCRPLMDKEPGMKVTK